MWFVLRKPGTHIKDESNITLVTSILNVPPPPLNTHSKGGWTMKVSERFSQIVSHFTPIPMVWPFIVGGVGTDSVESYNQLLTLSRVANDWNNFMSDPSLEALKKVESAFAQVSFNFDEVLPEGTALSRLVASLESIEKACNTILYLNDCMQKDDCLTVESGSLAETYGCIDVKAIATKLIGNNIVHLSNILNQEIDFSLLADVQDWILEYKGKDEKVMAAIATIKDLYASAQRTGNLSKSSGEVARTISAWYN